MGVSAKSLESLSYILPLFRQSYLNRMRLAKRKEERNGNPRVFIAMPHL